MIARLLVVCLSVFYISGCGGGGGSNPPTYTDVAAGTELGVYGVSDNAVINRDYLYVTIDRSKSFYRNYSAFEWTLDKQLAEYVPATFNDPNNKDIKRLTVPIYTGEGDHQFAIRGIMRRDPYDGQIHTEFGKIFKFNVKYKLNTVANGKYFGDRTVYKAPFTNFSGMRVEFAAYSASRSGSTLSSGGLKLTDTSSTATSYNNVENIFGTSISVNQTHNTVDFKMDSIANGEFLSAFGTGYDNFMELLLRQGPLGDQADRQGDLRLYRTDSGSRILSAMITSLKVDDKLPEQQATMTLQSFDNINFFGHLRLWNKNSFRVWTYQVSAYADAGGLSKNNGLQLFLSTSTSPIEDFLLRVTPYSEAYNIINPPGSPISKKPGFLTVGTDSAGKLRITQLLLILNDDVYRAAENDISMKASYKP